MKKILKYLAGTVLLLSWFSCKPAEETYGVNVDTRFSRTGNITLIASIENASVKASITGRGEARWLSDDKILVLLTDGTTEEMFVDGTGGTRRAIFKGTVPEGKTLGNYAFYPKSAISSASEGSIQFTLPSEMGLSQASDCSVAVAPIEESVYVEFRQILSYALLEFSNVSSDTRKIVLSSDRNLSGSFTASIPSVLTEGAAAVSGNNTLTILTGENPEPTFTVTVPLPVGTYNLLTAKAYDASGKNTASIDLINSLSEFDRGAMRSIGVVMPDAPKKEPKEGAALVADIYWALGNLEHVVGSTGDGFQTDWRLGPAQWHYSNCENAESTAKAVVYKPTDYSNCSHFNYGGIEYPFDAVVEHGAAPAVGTQIAGKMFTDRSCTVETTDFSAAKYGDIAFWASKGKYRMPTAEEVIALLANASRQYGLYTPSPGHVIPGILFFDPVGDAPVFSDVEAALTDEDLAKGVFFPYAGRRYNTQPFQVNVQGTQGPYRTGDCETADGANEGVTYGGILALLNAAPRAYPYFNKAIDAQAGLSIRPVLVDQQ